MHFLKQFQYYGVTPCFRIKKHRKHSNYFDIIIAVIVNILTICYAVVIGKELFLKKHPTISTQKFIEQEPFPIDLGDGTFFMAFGLQDSKQNHFFGESIYSIEAHYVYSVKGLNNQREQKERKEIILKRCSEISFSILPSYYNNLPLDSLYCITNFTNLTLSGNFDSQDWYYLEFNVLPCDNSKTVCEANLEKKLSRGYFGLYLIDKNIIPSNHKNYVTLFGKNHFNSYSFATKKEIWFFFQTINFETDEGLLFPSVKKESFFTYEEQMVTTDVRDKSEENQIIQLNLRASNNRLVYQRNYLRIADVFASIFAINKIIVFFGELVVFYFQDQMYRSYMCSFFEVIADKKSVAKTCMDNFINQSGSNLFEGNEGSYNNNINDRINNNQKSLHHCYSLKRFKSTNLPVVTSYCQPKTTCDIYPAKKKQKKNLQDSTINNHSGKDKKGHSFRVHKRTELTSKDVFKFLTCNFDTIVKFRNVSNDYFNISIYFDVIRYLKLYKDVDLLKHLNLMSSDYHLLENDYSLWRNSDATVVNYKNDYTFLVNNVMKTVKERENS